MSRAATSLASDPAAFRRMLMIPAASGPARLADVVAPFQVKDFEALDRALLALIANTRPEPSRFFICRTKGASKDSDLSVAMLFLLACSPRPLSIQVGAADQSQANELHKAAKGILRLNPFLASVLTVQNWSIVNTRSDSRLEIVAADVAGSHGARPDVLILNELTHIAKEDFAKNLLDNASKVPNGLVVILTNAGHVPSWQHDLYTMARESPARWYFSEYLEPAPWLDPREIEEAKRRNSPQRFARLWRGQWVRSLNEALSAADIEGAVTLTGPMTGSESGYRFYAGVDVGVTRDFSAFSAVAMSADMRVRLAMVQDWAPRSGPGGKVDLAKVEAAILDAHQRFRFRKILFDPHQMAQMSQSLIRAGLPMVECPFTPANLTLMATSVLERFHSKTISLYPDAGLLADLHELKLLDRGTSFRLEASRNSFGHGDRGTAFCIALAAAEKYGYKTGRLRVAFVGAGSDEEKPVQVEGGDWLPFSELYKRKPLPTRPFSPEYRRLVDGGDD